ncbi:MAG: hypothetical protein ACKV2U_15315 [Bryobacteraceae bacterium]
MQILGATMDGTPLSGDRYVSNPLVVRPFIERFNLSFPVGAMDPMKVNEFGQYSPMKRTYVPFLYFIDKTGTIRAQYMGSDSFFQDEPKNIRNLINTVFGVPDPASVPPPKPPAKTTQPVKRAPATAKKTA